MNVRPVGRLTSAIGNRNAMRIPTHQFFNRYALTPALIALRSLDAVFGTLAEWSSAPLRMVR